MARGTQYISPTEGLPSVKTFSSLTFSELRGSINYLRALYNPEVRGSRRRRAQPKDLSTHTQSELETSLDAIRGDAFERAHAISWLTALIMHSDTLMLSVDEDETTREELIGEAAALLAACAGTASSGRLIRSFTFGSSQSSDEITIQLMDAPLDNDDYASVGAQTWGAAVVMADMVLESPASFGLAEDFLMGSGYNAERPFRVLELGAGTGLVGMAIAKILELRKTAAEVVLTDVHPPVLANLLSNVALNPPSLSHESLVKVSVSDLDWEELSSTSATQGKDEPLGRFDLIIGADIIYEVQHAEWIKECLRKLLSPKALFHLVIPLRHTHTKESGTIGSVFGRSCEASERSIEILHRERFVCDAYSGGKTGEVEYEYFKIGYRDFAST